MSLPNLTCEFCGYGPIKSGLEVCRGCGATISYEPPKLTRKGCFVLAGVAVSVVAFAVVMTSFGKAVDRGVNFFLWMVFGSAIAAIVSFAVSIIHWQLYGKRRANIVRQQNIENGIAVFRRRMD